VIALQNLSKKWIAIGLVVALAVVAVLTWLGPVEKVLGENLRLVLLHGAWVWAGKIAFALSGLAGLLYLAFRRPWQHDASQALAHTGLVFWLTYLPMSVLIQQINWGGIAWQEPRFRIPLAFGVAAVLLQIAVGLFNTHWLTALVNLVFASALWVALRGAENFLHPNSPVFGGNSVRIQSHFLLLLAAALVVGMLLTVLLFPARKTTSQPEIK